MFYATYVSANAKVTVTERFGIRMRQLRQERRLSQVDLSDSTGMEQAFVSRLENGKAEPSLATLDRLAKAFGLSLSQLLKGV
jgi:transcriptional regulator with XRE-family HTH domain